MNFFVSSALSGLPARNSRNKVSKDEIISAAKADIPEYKYNDTVFPSEVEKNLSFLFAYKKIFKGDCFDFDYHLMWEPYKDLGGLGLASVISEDVKGLKKAGMEIRDIKQFMDWCAAGPSTYPNRRELFENRKKALEEQLRELENDNLIIRKVYPVVPPKVEYSLTEKGESLIPIINSICHWGEANRPVIDGEVIVHKWHLE